MSADRLREAAGLLTLLADLPMQDPRAADFNRALSFLLNSVVADLDQGVFVDGDDPTPKAAGRIADLILGGTP